MPGTKSPLLLILAGVGTLALAYKLASGDQGQYTENRRRGKRRGKRGSRAKGRKRYVGYRYKGHGMKPRRSRAVMSTLRKLAETGKSVEEVASIMKSKFAKDIRQGTLSVFPIYE
jgi:hypothetical protein